MVTGGESEQSASLFLEGFDVDNNTITTDATTTTTTNNNININVILTR